MDWKEALSFWSCVGLRRLRAESSCFSRGTRLIWLCWIQLDLSSTLQLWILSLEFSRPSMLLEVKILIETIFTWRDWKKEKGTEEKTRKKTWGPPCLGTSLVADWPQMLCEIFLGTQNICIILWIMGISVQVGLLLLKLWWSWSCSISTWRCNKQLHFSFYWKNCDS